MELIKLDWVQLDSQFSKGWMASTAFGSHYVIYFDTSKGKTKVRTLDRKDEYMDSTDEAKEWCQKDFENKVKECFKIN